MNHKKDIENLRICIEDLATALCNCSHYDVAQSIFRRYDARSITDLSLIYFDIVYAELKDAAKELL